MTATISPEDRDRALDAALKGVHKKYGQGSVMRLGDRPAVDVEVIPSGSLALDVALGVGGIPRGRVVEIYGPEASGKTTLTLHLIAEAQAAGGTAAFVDAEHALDVPYARNLGVQTDDLLVAQPDNGEQALEITEALVRSGAVDVVVLDSVAALVPRAEVEGEMGDTHVGLQARLMSQALRKLTAVAGHTNTTIVFINQIRHKIGVMFGNGEVTTGGNALKFYSSMRIEVRRIGRLTDRDDVIGNRTRIRVVKNKLAAPFRTIEVDLVYGRGICRAGDVIELAEQHGILEKNGSWYKHDGESLGQGRERVRDLLLEDDELFAKLAMQVRQAALPAPEAVAEAK